MVRLVGFINPLPTGSEKSKCQNTWQSLPSGNHVMIQQNHFWTSDLAIFSFFQYPGLSQESKPTQHGEMGSISTASCSFSTALRHIQCEQYFHTFDKINDSITLKTKNTSRRHYLGMSTFSKSASRTFFPPIRCEKEETFALNTKTKDEQFSHTPKPYCLLWGLNSRPLVYETSALPLS